MLSVLWLVCSAVSLHTISALASQVVLEDSSARDTIHDRQGAVASESKICSQIGIDLMAAGGNAADAVGRYQLIGRAVTYLVPGRRNDLLRRCRW